MNYTKRRILRIFFGIELVIFFFFYLFGAHGLQSIRALMYENSRLEHEIVELQSKIALGKQECLAWQTSDIRKEAMARERLQMAKPQEEIYYIL